MFRRILLAVCVLAAVIACVDVAIAQPAAEAAPAVVAQPSIAPIVNPDGTFNFTPLVDGFIKLVGGVLGLVGAWILARCEGQIREWFGINIDLKKTAKDLGMEPYANSAAAEAIAWVKQQGFKDTDLQKVEIRNEFLAMAARYLFQLDPDVWVWVSKKEESVMKWIESKLDPSAALPAPVAKAA